MRESQSARAARTKTIIQKLKRYYPDAHCALHHQSPLQLLMATILSAQCTDERVNKVTPALFARFPEATDFAKASLVEIETIIRSTGFFHSKAKSLKGTGQAIGEKFAGKVPRTVEELTSLPGVGRKTANVVLGNAFGLAHGIVVDTHVKRLAFRLGLTAQKSPERVEQDLLKLVPRADWIQFSHWLIFHGRQLCRARRPVCEKCPFEGLCPKRGVTLAH